MIANQPTWGNAGARGRRMTMAADDLPNGDVAKGATTDAVRAAVGRGSARARTKARGTAARVREKVYEQPAEVRSKIPMTDRMSDSIGRSAGKSAGEIVARRHAALARQGGLLAGTGLLGYAVGKPARAKVDKAYFDPEDRRQRRLGQAEAGASLAAGGLAAAGVRSARRATRNHVAGHKYAADKAGFKIAPKELRGVMRVTPRAAGLLAGAGAAGYGAERIRRHANSEQGSRWN